MTSPCSGGETAGRPADFAWSFGTPGPAAVLSHHYEMLGKTSDRGDEAARGTSPVAARAAFCDEDTRAGLFERITV